jgi:hypothetical protein
MQDRPWLTGDGGREKSCSKRPQGFSRSTLGASIEADTGSEPEKQVLESPGLFGCPASRMRSRWQHTGLAKVVGKKLFSVHGGDPPFVGKDDAEALTVSEQMFSFQG